VNDQSPNLTSMKTLAPDEDGAEPAHCFACHRALADGVWFARIKLGNRRVLFCRPHCVETFLEEQKLLEENHR